MFKGIIYEDLMQPDVYQPVTRASVNALEIIGNNLHIVLGLNARNQTPLDAGSSLRKYR